MVKIWYLVGEITKIWDILCKFWDFYGGTCHLLGLPRFATAFKHENSKTMLKRRDTITLVSLRASLFVKNHVC